ncbi:MAG: multicomponent Na+:H+ antiporter subunit [Candidatus Sumerlaeota bacterium]|nr:multicomponent Na+:H+ antiporter subunit [Candidatus Sumerlaeota bacterium]
MSNSVLLPILIPLIGAIICLFFRGSLKVQRIVSGAVATAMPFVAFALLLTVREHGVMVLRSGAWPGPFGIVFALDQFGAIMLVLSGIVQAAAWWFLAAGALDRERETFLLHPLFLFLCTGVNWAFSTGDLFNLFVSFEIILLASYALISHGNERTQIRESLKYVILNLVASTLFLVAAGFTYGMFGSLNLAELAVRFAQLGYPPETRVLGTLFLFVFGMKAALYPMFYWLPDAYPKAPRGISAYFAGILTKVGVYCLYRVFTLLFRDEGAFASWFQPIILAIGGLTMIVGVMGALSQFSFRRILSFHIISQIGYMIFGLGIFTPLAIAAGIFYIIHHIIVKAALFLVGDAVEVNEGSQSLRKVAGLVKLSPALSVFFLLAAFSLAGIPPLSGFYGKYGLAVEGYVEGHAFYVAVSLLTSLFTIASMAKIWRYSFWGERPEGAAKKLSNTGVVAATGGLVAVSVVVALASAWIMGVSTDAANQLLDRTEYVDAVLGTRGVEALQLAMKEPVE